MDLFDDIGFLMSRGSGMVVRTTNAHLAPTGLRVRQYSVLSVACDAEGVTQRELSDLLGLDPSQIVALVDELEAAGFVERQPDPRDRRTRLVTATRRGRSTRQQASRLVETARTQFLAPLSDDERSLLVDLVRRVVVGDRSDDEVAS